MSHAENGTVTVRDLESPPAVKQATLKVRPISEYESTPVHWIWDGWLARGKITILAGVEGDGKSMVTCDIVARLSSGRDLPDGSSSETIHTLMLIAEDGIEDTVRPRLERHDAVLDKILIAQGIQKRTDILDAISLDQHLGALEQSVVENDIDLVVIDPLSSYMPGSNRNDEGAVRDVLTKLVATADRTGVAFLCIHHLNRPNGINKRATQRLLGSTAFPAIARSVWMVAPRDELGRDDRRVIEVVKSNLARRPEPLEWSLPQGDTTIVWHGVSSVSVHALLDQGAEASAVPSIQNRIVDLLQTSGETLSSSELAHRLNLGIQSTRNALTELVRQKRVERVGRGQYAAVRQPSASDDDYDDVDPAR